MVTRFSGNKSKKKKFTPRPGFKKSGTTRTRVEDEFKKETIYIYGKHALMEALATTPQAVTKVFLSDSVDDKEVRDELKKHSIKPGVLAGGKSPKQISDWNTHQGIVGHLKMASIIQSPTQFFDGLTITADTALMMFDEVQDPHNVGAAIRAAAGFGIAGVLVPERNQSPITGAVVKVSSGMVFRIPMVRIGDVVGSIKQLKEKGFTIYGLEGKGETNLNQQTFPKPSVFILGNEGRGMQPEVRALCDHFLSIPLHDRCESLNAATAIAVTLHTWSMHHTGALK
jgi:23S rRNA (guanosine2251-2'-O)-methyltransferase